MGLFNFKLMTDEVLLYKLEKKAWMIPFLVIFCPIWLLFASFFIVPCFNSIFMGTISFESLSNYFLSIFSLLFFVPISIISPISYILNQLIITDKRVYLRKGVIGQGIIINYDDIIAYTHFLYSSKGFSNSYISFYLKNGKRIKSGNLHIKSRNLDELLVVLEQRIGKQVNTMKEIKELKQKANGECILNISQSIIPPILSFLPLIIAFLMLALYMIGFNNIGYPKDVEVLGIVETKEVNYNKNREISGYEITIRDIKSNIIYEAPVNKEIFNNYSELDKVLIKAKKGKLGILYDQWFYKK